MWGTLSNEALTARQITSSKTSPSDIRGSFQLLSENLKCRKSINLIDLLLSLFMLICVLPGDRFFDINDVDTQVEFKSHQWFGATVRSHGNSILVRLAKVMVDLFG